MHNLIIYISIFIGSISYSQQWSTLVFHLDKGSNKFKLDSNSVHINQYKKDILQAYQLKGYAGVKIIDSSIIKEEKHYVIDYDAKFKKIIFTDSVEFTSVTFEKTYNQINKKLTELENIGYPFAKLRITDQNIRNNRFILQYKIDSGYFVIIDKIHLKSEDDFNEKTILNLIDTRVGRPYNENKLKKISNLLKASNLYESLREPEVLFKKGKAEIFIYFKKKKSSSADGYVGLLQDKITQKLSLNGYINLNLTNTLNRGEFLNLNWKSNPDKTQNLKFNFAYPYIFNTPIGVETDLNLHKQDTSFVKSLANFGINFQQPFYQVGIFNQIEKSSILTNNTTYQIRNFSKNTTGLKLMFRPQFTGKLSLYQPKISTKFGLFNYKSDSISSIANTTNLSYLVQLEQKINFFKYFSFTNTSGIQGMNSSYVLSRNELIYFGGLKSVRGFYELELVGNHLFTTLNEIEYQPLSILSFKLLYDYSSFENNGKFHSNSFGFGFGLLNKNSVLEIIIANGVINSSNVDFANTKIHIGFSSSF